LWCRRRSSFIIDLPDLLHTSKDNIHMLIECLRIRSKAYEMM
jgi:hypothetical protein